MGCCSPQGYRTVFGERAAGREARRFRRKGLAGSARFIVAELVRAGIKGRSVLEVGGGVGGLQIELLAAGAARTTNVEIVDTYERAAAELLHERSMDDRAARLVGDVVTDAALAPGADVVVLHRVICCYPDADGLMQAACARAAERVAVTVPNEDWWIRLGFAFMNATFRLRRLDFRVYVHPVAGMLRAAGAHGFGVAGRRSGRIWQTAILRRV